MITRGKNVKMEVVLMTKPEIAPEFGQGSSSLEHQLLWPGNYSDLDRFPERKTLHDRYSCNPLERCPIQAFVYAVLFASDRVWILDPFFGEQEQHNDKYYRSIPNLLWEAMLTSEVSSLRFITKPTFERGLLQNIRDSRAETGIFPAPRYGADWLGELRGRNEYPYAHDRFAVIDDELWHFGGTVGASQAGLTAASRGWSAVYTGAADFFRELWRDLGGEPW